MSEKLDAAARAFQTIDPRDANDLAVGWFGMSATWAFDNIFQIIGTVVAILSFLMVVRRHKITKDADSRQKLLDGLAEEKLRLEIKALRGE